MKEIPKGLIVWQNCSAPNQEGSVVTAERRKGGEKIGRTNQQKGGKSRPYSRAFLSPGLTHLQ